MTGMKDSVRKSILVVDDEENLRHMLKVLLQKLGYSVDLAEDGGAAIIAAPVFLDTRLC